MINIEAQSRDKPIIHKLPPETHSLLLQHYNGKLCKQKRISHKGMHSNTFTTLEGSYKEEAHLTSSVT